MGKRELIARELDQFPDLDLDTHDNAELPTLAAESALAKDWLTPEEDESWATLRAD